MQQKAKALLANEALQETPANEALQETPFENPPPASHGMCIQFPGCVAVQPGFSIGCGLKPNRLTPAPPQTIQVNAGEQPK